MFRREVGRRGVVIGRDILVCCFAIGCMILILRLTPNFFLHQLDDYTVSRLGICMCNQIQQMDSSGL